jgi:fructokinase
MIVCCGEALIDMVPDGGRADVYLARPGGCPYNTAIAAARLGSTVEFIGRIGTDFLGEQLVERLKTNDVGTRFLARRDEPTTLAFVNRSPSGDARYAFYSKGAADRSLSPEDIPLRLDPQPRFLMFGSISLVQEPIASTIEAFVARESGRAIASFDPNIRPSLIGDREAYLSRLRRWLSLSSIVKASTEDLEWIYPGVQEKEAIARLLGSGPELVVVTRGSKGAIAATKRAEAEVGGISVDIVDTIGAGDTFHAALLYQLDRDGLGTRNELQGLDGERIRAILEFSNAAAAADCTRSGAEPPFLEEVKKWLPR